MYERADLAEKPRLPDDAVHRLMSEAWEQSSRSLATRTTVPDVLDFSKNDPLSKQTPERVLSPVPIGSVRTEFNQRITQELRSLPNYLQDALKDYQIYTSVQPGEYINEARNHGIQIEAEDRQQLRGHVAFTDRLAHTQNFSEYMTPQELSWHPFAFEGMFNFRGTVAHEAEHAWDERLGDSSQTDPEFDRRYQLGVDRLMSVNTPETIGWLTNYVVFDDQGNLKSGPGKAELFADLGAMALTGEAANKFVDTGLLRALFRVLNEYCEPRFKSGKR